MTSALRDTLRAVKHLHVRASGLDRVLLMDGRANVTVFDGPDDAIIFDERGNWLDQSASRFWNVYRWTPLANDAIRLVHLRGGAESPVHLADLVAKGEGVWEPDQPHVCGADSYLVRLELIPSGMTMRWHIHGPRKPGLLMISHYTKELTDTPHQ